MNCELRCGFRSAIEDALQVSRSSELNSFRGAESQSTFQADYRQKWRET
jgi:hypothetical protein